MGMTIDEAINHIKYGIIENNYPLQRDLGIEACNLALDTMRKYQKICKILDKSDNAEQCMYDTIQEIEEVRDGNDD